MKSNYLNILGRNTASNFFFFFVNTFLGIASYAILIRYLTLEDYGMLLFATAFLGQFAFLDGGLSTALEKFIPEFRVNDEPNKINQSILATVAFFAFVGSVIAILLVFFISIDGMEWFNPESTADANKFLLVAAAFSPFVWLIKGLNGALKGFNKYHEINIYDTIIRFFTITGSIALAVLGYTAFWIFILQQVLVVIKGSIYWIQLQKIFKTSVSKVKFTELVEIFKYIFSYSLWIMIMRFSSLIINQFDKMIVSGMLGVKSLPIYIGIIQLMKILSKINNKLKSAVIPIASEISITESSEKFNQVALRGIKAMNAIASPITIFIVVFSEPILILMGKDNLIEYNNFFRIGVILFMFIGSRAFLQSMHTGSGELIKFLGKFSVISALGYLFISYFSISYFGLEGAILALPITHLVVYPVWLHIVLGETDIPLGKYFLTIWEGQWPSILLMVVFLGFNFIFSNQLNFVWYFFEGIAFISIVVYLSFKYSIEKIILEKVLGFLPAKFKFLLNR